MKFRSYNREVKIATALVENVFNNIVISRMDRDSKVSKEIRVPLVYGARPRVLKELENPKKTIKPPILALVKEGLSRDSERMSELYSYKRDVPDGYVALARMKAVPVSIEFTLSGISVYEDDLDQIVSNFAVFFKPDIFVSWHHPQYQAVEIRSQLVWDGKVNSQYPVEVGVDDHEFYQFETSFTFKTWLFPGFMGGTGDGGGDLEVPLIEKVNFSASPDFFSVGDPGYGVSGLYAVPTTMGYSEFIRLVNSGSVTYDHPLSWPLVVEPPSMDMQLCYPVHTRRDAVTVKLTLLGEDRDDPEFDPAPFGFDEESRYGDCTTYHFRTLFDSSESGGTYSYLASSEWDGEDGLSISVRSSLESNYPVNVRTPELAPLTCPSDPAATYGGGWRITSSNPTVLSLFSSSGQFEALPMEEVCWESTDGNTLNVKRLLLTAGEDFSRAPTRVVLEGLCEGGRWRPVRAVECGEWTESGQVKCFDCLNDEQQYLALRLVVGHPQDGGSSVVLGRILCSSEPSLTEAPEGYVGSREATSTYRLTLSPDPESSLEVARTAGYAAHDPGRTEASSSGAIELLNAGEADLDVPGLGAVTPVRFAPMRYLTFSYRGRKYGLSTEGGFGDGAFLAQTITYGEQFPVTVKDGSVHVMTNSPGLPMYQYDGRYRVWFSIGNQTRPGVQRIAYLEGAVLSAGSELRLPLGIYLIDETVLELSFTLAGDVVDDFLLRISCGSSSVVRRVKGGTGARDRTVRFLASGTDASTDVAVRLEGDDGGDRQVAVSSVLVAGYFHGGDRINDPEYSSGYVAGFLEGRL